MILGLQRPNAGQVRILGAPRASRNRLVGYVPQKILLDPDMPMRARDVVALGIDGIGMPNRFPSMPSATTSRARMGMSGSSRIFCGT